MSGRFRRSFCYDRRGALDATMNRWGGCQKMDGWMDWIFKNLENLWQTSGF